MIAGLVVLTGGLWQGRLRSWESHYFPTTFIVHYIPRLQGSALGLAGIWHTEGPVGLHILAAGLSSRFTHMPGLCVTHRLQDLGEGSHPRASRHRYSLKPSYIPGCRALGHGGSGGGACYIARVGHGGALSCLPLLGLKHFLVSSWGFGETVELNQGKKLANDRNQGFVQRPPRLLC